MGKKMPIHFFLHVFFLPLVPSSLFVSNLDLSKYAANKKRKRTFVQVAAGRKEVTATNITKTYFHKIITNVKVLEARIWHHKIIGSSRR